MRLFGTACLVANDLSAFESPKPLPTDLSIAANMLPNTEYFSQEDYDREIARTLFLFNELAPNAIETRLPALAQRLQDLLGYTVTHYCDLAVTSAMKPISADTARIEDFQIPALMPEQFATTRIEPETAKRFLVSISGDENALADSITSQHTHAADFTFLRDRPLLIHNGTFVPLDAGFILDKAGRSLFWTALKNAPQDERDRILSDYGALFERYVNGIFAANIGPDSTFLASPHFSDRAEACDGAITEGRTLIVIEYKATTINNAIKYADDPETLKKLLEQRFVEGEGHGRKGLGQLWHAIKRFAEGNPLIGSDGSEVQSADVGTIMPVLVHLDNALRTPGIPHYLAGRFKSLGRIKKYTITPLVLLPITELEELEGHMHDSQLRSFLESFLDALHKDRATVFFTRTLPILRGKKRKSGPTLKRFDQYFDDLMKRLFPSPPHDSVQPANDF